MAREPFPTAVLKLMDALHPVTQRGRPPGAETFVIAERNKNRPSAAKNTLGVDESMKYIPTTASWLVRIDPRYHGTRCTTPRRHSSAAARKLLLLGEGRPPAVHDWLHLVRDQPRQLCLRDGAKHTEAGCQQAVRSWYARNWKQRACGTDRATARAPGGRRTLHQSVYTEVLELCR